MPAARFRRYLMLLGATGLAILITVGGFNLLVDPYGLFGLVRRAEFNAEKPEQGRHTRLWKAHQIRLQRPAALVLGSSRAEYGIDPSHPAWRVSGPVFNAALPSGSIHEALAYLRHAQGLRPLEKVVLGLDFFMFNTTQQLQPDFNAARLTEPGTSPLSLGWLRDLVVGLWSFDALGASWQTLQGQGVAGHVPYLNNGMYHPTRNAVRIVQRGGHHAAFRANERYSLTAVDGWALFTRAPQQPDQARPIDDFRSLVRFCREHDITLYLFISPVHARKKDLLWQIGLWEEFENWKRDLVGVLAEDARLHPDQEEYPLWDFSGFNRVTTEPVPPPGDSETAMRHYWEGSHYRKEVGDRILDRLLRSGPGIPTEGTFGTRVDRHNIEEHLAEIRAAHGVYVAKNPEAVMEIRQLIANTREEWEALRRGLHAAL